MKPTIQIVDTHQHLWDEDRVLFGSDWPVCTLSASYRQWVEALQAITQAAGDENQRKVFCDNAVRVYRLT